MDIENLIYDQCENNKELREVWTKIFINNAKR